MSADRTTAGSPRRASPRLAWRRLAGARHLAALARRWERQARVPVAWLDSSQGHPQRGRVSVLARLPRTALALGRSCRRRDGVPDLASRCRAAFDRGRAGALGRGFDPDDLGDAAGVPFLGGWIGYLAYEAQIDCDVAFPGRDVSLPYPRVWFREAECGVTVVHDRDETWLWARVAADGGPGQHPAFDDWERTLDDAAAARATNGGGGQGWSVAAESLDRVWYERSVRDVLERIRAGEIYQVNLTCPVPVEAGRDPLGTYLRLRRSSPGDFSAYLDWPGLTLLASSPEEFVAVRGRQVLARPMKGTRPRGDRPASDQALKRELAESLKDRAENVMIVDLIRNDLGRVANVGSVKVPELFAIETYATVHQMTSTVVAEMRDGVDVFDVIEAVFPPGSMTGTPKVQATRVIRGLESEPRGLYSGCLGAIDWRGDAVFNVVIRSLVGHARGASWAVGGGIVADSDPTGEYEEARLKLLGLVRALGPQQLESSGMTPL